MAKQPRNVQKDARRQMSVAFSDTQKRRLEYACSVSGLTLAEYVRRCVDNELARSGLFTPSPVADLAWND